MKYIGVLFISIFLIFVQPAYAGVVINEVAWMGTASSATDEWIELYSDGGQNLEGWKLETSDGGMSVALSGNINGYYLIERTDDSTVPEVPADLVVPFGSGLANSGEILILKDASGNEADRVDGSNNWTVGGNNTTKETLQRVGSANWITAAPTPRAENANSPLSSEPSEADSDENIVVESNQSGATTNQTPPKNTSSKLKADAGEDRIALAGAEVEFLGIASGVEGGAENNVQYFWNFGDGHTASGKNVSHTFSFPGAYNVFLNVSLGGSSASDSAKITVVENPVVISEIAPERFLELHNASPRKIDFSRFGIRVGTGKPFYFSSGTFLAPYAYLALGQPLLGFDLSKSGEANILYPSGKILFSSFYSDIALGNEDSLSLVGGEWVKSKATPGEKNEVFKITKSRTATQLQERQGPNVNNPKEINEEIKMGETIASVAKPEISDFSPLISNFQFDEYGWLFIGLGVGILGGLIFIFIKKVWIT